METKTTVRDRVEAYIHTPGAAMSMCANCAHYYPHYREDGWPLGCGHCSYPRMKQRRAYDLCEHWEAVESGPVSRPRKNS